MASLRKLWDDIRGNLLWQAIVWIAGGGLITAIAQAVKLYQGYPLEWGVVGLIFIVSTLSLAVIVLLAARSTKPPPQQGNQALIPAAPPHLPIDEVYYGIDANVRAMWERPIRDDMAAVSPEQRETHLVRSLTIVVIALDFQTIWMFIYGSQIQALEQLNRSGAVGLTREEILPHYRNASVVYTFMYLGFTFDNWLAFFRNQGLATENHDRIVILPKGREFLKYLINNGKSASDRLY
jgi:hypothetical protein